MDEKSNYEDNIALACIAMTSIFGLISNGIALYMTRKMSRFRNTFGILCSNFLICNLQSIIVLFMWSTIVLIVKNPLLSSSELFLPRLVGVFVNGGWFGSLFVHSFISLNRLCAIAFPMKYKKLWSKAKAPTIGIISWTIGMTICMIHLHKDCSLLFDGKTYDFNYQDSFYGNICSYSDTGLTLIMVIAKTFLDVLTLIKILAYRKVKPERSTTSSGARKEREILFFKQSSLLNIIFFICFAILAGHEFLLTNKWLIFAASTITWIMMQSLDGLIFLIFNLRMFWKTIWLVAVTPVTHYGHHIVTRF